jgi:DNA invertase Pin-like site-specific DNA recombinase
LKWATLQERAIHHRSNPNYAKANAKLTEKQVLTIKQKLSLGKTTLKQIALKFGVSDMQVHRIKTGENWGRIKI